MSCTTYNDELIWIIWKENALFFRVFKAACECGIDIFRVYDALNYLPNVEMIIKIVKSLGAVIETGIVYTGDLADPNESKYALKDYIQIADKFVEAGAHILAVMVSYVKKL